MVRNGQTARIFNLGCGPAGEVQNFLSQDEYAIIPSFVLLDFNDETLQHTRKILEDLKNKYDRGTKIEIVKKSVHQVLREESQARCATARIRFGLLRRSL